MLRGRSVFKFIVAELHLWLGLVSGLIVFILCLTGTIYALKPQIEDRLKAVEHQFDELLENDVKKFNEQLEKSRHKIDLEKKS